jgi:hypothetical protein
MALLAASDLDRRITGAEWLVEIDLDARWRPDLPELLRFRDSVWAAGGSVREAGPGWTVAVIVQAHRAGEAQARALAISKRLECAFAAIRQIEASPVE